MPREQNLLSIGALSRASGIPADTLRTWERRYGFPAPVRTESGHRRYAISTLDRLQLVTKALAMGHRPAVVLPADVDALAVLVGETQATTGVASMGGGYAASGAVRIPATPITPPGGALDSGSGVAVPFAQAPTPPANFRTDDTAGIQDRLVEHILRFEGRAFDRELRRAWAVLGGMRFISETAAPLLQTVGERWASGEMSVAHEHFCSERLRDFLVQQWRPLADTATGPEVVLATPTGESHVMGLQLAATALALHNVRIVFLGADAPPQDIVRAVTEHGCAHVILSVSETLSPQVWEEFHAKLRRLLPPSVHVVAGGSGAAALQAEGLQTLCSFDDLATLFRPGS